MEGEWKGEREEDKPEVGAEDISEVVAMWTGIPVTRIASEESQRLLQMEDALHEKVVGQDEAIHNIAKAVRRARAGLKDPRRPDRRLHVPRPHGRRQDLPRPHARRVHVRQPKRT